MRLTLAAALCGAADTASFVWTRREGLRAKPGRLVGSLVSLGIWSGIAAGAAAGRRAPTRALAGAALTANGAMLAVHLRHRIATPRVFAGVGLAAAALAGSLRGA